MEDSVVIKAFCLMRWSLLLLSLVVACEAQCSFSDHGSNAAFIDMDSCGLTTVNPDELTRFTNLQTLKLQNNGLATFPDVSPVGTTLKTLNLGKNQITHVSDDVLRLFLKTLETLRLYTNHLTTFPNVSAVGSTLRLLDLNSNQITHISDDLLIHLSMLDTLQMNNNCLTTFPNLTAVGTTLGLLTLSGNQLSEVSDGSFLELVTLEDLQLNNNPSLKRVAHLVQGLRNIKQIWIHDTGIFHLPPIVHENVTVLELNIERSVNVCLCENAWLKQEGPKMAIFKYDDANCDGQLWSTMTVDDMIAKCRQERQQKHKQLTRAKAVPTQMTLSPFRLHSLVHELKIDCTAKCMDTPGCVSFCWQRPQKEVGDCVLMAPGSSISVSSMPEGNLPVWTYFSMT